MIKISPIACSRLIVGFLQGLLLYWLYNALESNIWPATEALVFAPASLVIFIVPVLAILAAGNMRFRLVTIGCALSALLLVFLGLFDVERRGDQSMGLLWQHAKLLPSFSLCLASFVGFFIAQSLVMAGESEHKLKASYPAYFDIAWKLAIQINFSLIFVLMFWGILWLGASMFLMLKVHAVSDLLQHRWFSIPVTATAFSYAIHLTDVRMNLVRSIRTLKLTLMSWLLPLLTLFTAAFLLTIPVQGGELLWKTHHSSQILLVTMAMIILYLNAVYQDGLPEHAPRGILCYAGYMAAILLLPLWGLAIYGVALRVNQYGWTVYIIEVAACLVVMLVYALGYIWAACTPGAWLKNLEQTNVTASYAILVVLVALFTPLADPARLAVASQIARLHNGTTTLATFDYNYLSREGARYGEKALQRLHDEARGPDALAIQTKIDQAVMLHKKMTAGVIVQAPSPKDLVANVKVFPQGKFLPESFVKQDWNSGASKGRTVIPACLVNNNIRCEAYLIELDQNNVEMIILTNENLYGNAQLYQISDKGEWSAVGTLSNIVNCKSVREAMRGGDYKLGVQENKEIQVKEAHILVKLDEQCPEGTQ